MRKTYQIPSVVLTQLMPSAIVLAGSPTGVKVNNDPIPSTEGGD